MNHYRPSPIDQMLIAMDEIIRKGFSFLTGVETRPFEVQQRQWGYVAIPIRSDHREAVRR